MESYDRAELEVVRKALDVLEDNHPDIALHMVRDLQSTIDMGIQDVLWAIFKEGNFHPKEVKSYLLDLREHLYTKLGR